MKSTLTDDFLKKLSLNCEKHEVNADDQVKIVRWAEDVIMGSGIIQNIDLGFMEFAGFADDGQPKFTLSEAGSQRAKDLRGDDQ